MNGALSESKNQSRHRADVIKQKAQFAGNLDRLLSKGPGYGA